MFLVGGFAESAVLQQEIRNEFGHIVQIRIPQDTSLAILKGTSLCHDNTWCGDAPFVCGAGAALFGWCVVQVLRCSVGVWCRCCAVRLVRGTGLVHVMLCCCVVHVMLCWCVVHVMLC